ncbi:SRPBCC family protein [Streptomyces sp. NPDC052236]|uniref:SRPBCC family protein n=1 Tax=Streptomyces sp. NPDC052236 TaxID=3365686 RepID=UPI0037D5A1AA
MNSTIPQPPRWATAALLTTLALGLSAGRLATTAAAHPAHPPVTAQGQSHGRQDTVIDRHAPVITRDDIFIRASLKQVWDVQTDVENWPSWQPDVNSVQREDSGRLKPGSVFRWHVQGLDVTSTVKQVEPLRRLVWGGPANGITAVHVWTFTPTRHGVLVHTEESWSGAPVEANIPYAQGALDASLRGWLENLKRTAEARS